MNRVFMGKPKAFWMLSASTSTLDSSSANGELTFCARR